MEDAGLPRFGHSFPQWPNWKQWRHCMRTGPHMLATACAKLWSPVSPLAQEHVKELRDLTAGPLPAGSMVCELCPEERARVFNTAKALRTHMMREHGHRKMSRRFVAGTACPACGKDFGSRRKALDHLEYRAARCRRTMEGGGLDELAPEVVAALDAADRSRASS